MVEGFITEAADIDYFMVDINTASLITVDPFNVGINNEGANLDLVLKIYNRNKVLLTTINNPGNLSASASISTPGRYYVSVASAANEYASNYGMLGKYRLCLTPG